VREHVHECDFRLELSYSPADCADREGVCYLQKYLRRDSLRSVSDVVRCSIGGRSGTARKQTHFVSSILESRSKPSYVRFSATLPAIPVGCNQDPHFFTILRLN